MRPADITGQPARVGVIGAGFSGTMVTIHLLKRLPVECTVVLFERSQSFGRGAAYTTDDPLHLLNVRVGNMSAYPDRPNHFRDWLRRHARTVPEDVVETVAGPFASRRAYGRYLREELTAARVAPRNLHRFHPVPDGVSRLDPDGEGYQVTTDGGLRYRLDAIILATGVAGSAVANPLLTSAWAEGATDGLVDGVPVLVLGTGLSMVDLALSLEGRGFRGPIVAVSRRGLLPKEHRDIQPLARLDLAAPDCASPARLLQVLRREARQVEAAGGDWRMVFDALRPHIASLWQGFDVAAQRRFLRHGRRWWDCHRHRVAPSVGRQLAHLSATGRLVTGAARVHSISREPGAIAVDLEEPHGRREIRRFQRVFDATGLPDIRRSGDPLIRHLIDTGLAVCDPHGLSLMTDRQLRVVNAEGSRSAGLLALGPLVRGVFWESIAVPDIRLQAVEVAAEVAALLRQRHVTPYPVSSGIG